MPAAPVQQVVPAEATSVAAVGTPFADDVIPAGPAIRRLAREVGVDLAGVVGTGENGRITREDVMTVVRTVNQSARAGALVPVANEVATTTAAPVQQTDLEPPRLAKVQRGICGDSVLRMITVRFAWIA